MSSAADELAARGDPALTRAEAAQLAFGLRSAENKAEAYPLDYTDVEPGSDAAQAIAYLASYGLLTCLLYTSSPATTSATGSSQRSLTCRSSRSSRAAT